MEKISYTAHVSNKEVFSLVQKQRFLVFVIKQRQTKWIGHVPRRDCLLKTVLKGKIEDKRTWEKNQEKKMLNLLIKQEYKKISCEEKEKEELSSMASSSVEPALGGATEIARPDIARRVVV